MMNKAHNPLWLVFVFCSTVLWTPALFSAEPERCVRIVEDWARIKQRIIHNPSREKQALAAEDHFGFSPEQPYAEYLAYARKLIQHRNEFSDLSCAMFDYVYQQHNPQQLRVPKIVDLIAPFQLNASGANAKQKAVLLIHGLTDSPYLMRDLAEYFHRQGFMVRTLLLPGHGTRAADLIDVRYQDWQQAAHYAIERIKKDADQIYLGGYSTGATLILDYLLKFHPAADSQIKAALLWSPAIDSKAGILAGLLVPASLFMGDWLDKEADTDFAKYESFALNAGIQVNRLMQQVRGSWTRLFTGRAQFPDIPIFSVASQVDDTVDTAATLKLLDHWHHQSQRRHSAAKDLLIYYHGPGKAAGLKWPKVNIYQRLFPMDKQLYDIAHTSPTHKPDNPHYGANSRYRNCSHYLGKGADKGLKYYQCKTNQAVRLGERINLDNREIMARLTYNPYFDAMLARLSGFLMRVK